MLTLLKMLNYINPTDVFIPVTPGGDEPGFGTGEDDMESLIAAANRLFDSMTLGIIGLFGTVVLIIVGVFIFATINMGAKSGSPRGRQESLTRLLYVVIALILMGSLFTVMTLGWTMFK